ncbi:hypothetical protein [Robertmurraya kyonggiensis]|uniref:Uncharacterized protein n=1 Tax=Robertmurraya kyonggiensis TaxID=1037680 RepID=A0A4U1D0T2_9BACI|nr:hypothetical protein [Robertmurraya kyonggiensis]TKC15674.1 hypothetical protein FA727_16235 [Robertmurraya kyonggiensis]
MHIDNQPELSVTVGNGLTTIVGPGKALMQGYAYENTSDLILEHALPEATLDRIDRLVLRLDKRNQSRFIRLFVIQGEASANPVPPELTRDEFIYELSLARIRVRANTASLETTDLFDERLNEDLCGLVYSLISIPTSQFQQQWDAWFAKTAEYEQRFEDWFEGQQREGFVTQADYDDELKNEDVQTATLVQGENTIHSSIKAPINVVSVQGLTEIIDGQGFHGIVNPTIEVGDTREVIETTLHGMNGVYDEIIRVSGVLKKVEQFREMAFDDKLAYAFSGDFAGFKRVNIPLFTANSDQSVLASQLEVESPLVKYDGKTLIKNSSVTMPSQDCFKIDSTNGNLYITISDTDSGWGESYTPTADEIKAYFLGWKMYTDGQGFTSLYNGTGTKAWTPIETLGSSGCWYLGSIAPTVKASPKSITGGTYTVVNAWQPYRLLYQLATPQIITVSTKGTAMLEEGENTVKLRQGVVVRERVNPSRSSDAGFYTINVVNNGAYVDSPLKHKANKFLGVYKNKDLDTQWYPVYTQAYGNERMSIESGKFDPNAIYYATYEILPELTVKADNAEIEYRQNVKASLNEHTEKLAAHEERLDELEKTSVSKDRIIPKIKATLLNGFNHQYQGLNYWKDEEGYTNVEGIVGGGPTATNTVVFNLPDDFRTDNFAALTANNYVSSTAYEVIPCSTNTSGDISLTRSRTAATYLIITGRFKAKR